MRNVWFAFLGRQQGRLSLFLPVCLGGGICVYFGLSVEPPLGASWAAAATLCLVCAALWRQPFLRMPLLALAAASFGVALAALEAARQPPFLPLPRHAVWAAGRVEAVDILPAGRRITLAGVTLDSAPPQPRRVRIRLGHADPAPVEPGAIIRVRALLQPPAPPELPGGWDSQREAFFTGLGAVGFAIGPATVLQPAPASRLASIRQHLSERVLRALPGATGGVASALLTGLGSSIPAADRAAFAASGLAHLLAVAGLHIGIVMGLVFFAVRLGLASWEWAALHWPVRQVAALSALAAGFLYLLLTGAHVPILRSFFMAVLVTLGVLAGRRAISLRGLALAGTALLVAAPHLVMTVSFQMSFSAVLWLVAGYELARPALTRLGPSTSWRGPVLYTTGLALSSVLAGTGSLPFAAYHFGQASLYYVPANMLAVPLTAFWVMPWGLLAILLWPLGLIGAALAPMGWGIQGLLLLAHAVAAWPDATLPVPAMPAWCLALVGAGFACAGILRGWARASGALLAALGLGVPLLLRPPDAFLGTGARVIAVRMHGRVFADVASGTSSFEREAALRLWGIGFAPAITRGLDCSLSGCRAGAVFVTGPVAPASCPAPLVISHAWLPKLCGGMAAGEGLTLDKGFVARAGATAAWVSAGGVTIRTVESMRGDRPWVMSAQTRLPMAASE